MTNTPAGWYDAGDGSERYWDGVQWTENVRPLPAAAPPPMNQPPMGQPPAGFPPAGFPPAGGQPYHGGGGGGSKKTLIFVVLAAVLLIAGVAVVLALTLGGDDGNSNANDNDTTGGSSDTSSTSSSDPGTDEDSGPADDPKVTVERFAAAAKANDCLTARELTTGELRDEIDCSQTENPDEDSEYLVGDAVINGSEAEVPVSVSSLSGDIELNFELTQIDGLWYIHSAGPVADLPTMPTEPFPTEAFPTDPFSDLPTDFDSLFSDFPTDLFSDFPSDFPS